MGPACSAHASLYYIRCLGDLFWTLYRGLAVVVASGSPLVRILHSCDPYRRVGLTTAVYKSRKQRFIILVFDVSSLAILDHQPSFRTLAFRVR
jgi:hypothetical protein